MRTPGSAAPASTASPLWRGACAPGPSAIPAAKQTKSSVALAAVIRGRGACRHPDGTLRFVASAIDVFADEFADHGAEGPCDACEVPPALPLPRTGVGGPGRAPARAAR